jgi:hypothetical protein
MVRDRRERRRTISRCFERDDPHWPERIPETLNLPSGDFIGLSTGGDASIARRDGAPYDYALFRDGLALLGNPPPRRIAGVRIWYPNDGLK